MRFLTLVICSSIFFIGCKKPVETEPTKLYTSYFPLQENRWVEYEVTAIVHNNLGSDTSCYFLKEVCAESFVDDAGNDAMRIERLWKQNASDTYVIKDVWYANINSFRAEKVEENIRFIKLAFPVVASKTWKGNAFNTLENWNYSYDSLHLPKSYNNLNFDSTITVIQVDNVNPFQHQKAYEIYANYIGLIKKSYKNISNNVGDELYMNVIAYGI